MTTPPAAGARLTVRVDTALSDDLQTLMGPDTTASDAVRHAVKLAADTHRYQLLALDIRDDDELAADLTILKSTGQPVSDTVRHAIRLLADAYRCAWDHQDYPDGTAPTILSVRYARGHSVGHPGTSPSDTF